MESNQHSSESLAYATINSFDELKELLKKKGVQGVDFAVAVIMRSFDFSKMKPNTHVGFGPGFIEFGGSQYPINLPIALTKETQFNSRAMKIVNAVNDEKFALAA